MLELLSPVGNFTCLKAAVQNGADAVYFGADRFSARAFANNFSLSLNELTDAISYAKIRGVKTHLTLNTLIKDDEFDSAFSLAKTAYELGIDAIIVQDLGLAMKLISYFPDLPIHASTQMTVHNLNGALELQNLGFKRIVLARELTIDEIFYIAHNTNVEIECFAHGALCISFSGQCLFSSMVGGRSGNRGKCAQPCRLPFTLLENNKKINSGHLLSTRDLCGLDFIPSFLQAGVNSLKIEGRMKSPEYVATVTRIYRKYIDLANSDTPFKVEEKDRKDLMQVFNRGMSSSGHLYAEPNKNLVFKDKPNHMGLPLGIVQKYNASKGYITLKLKENIEIGDTISFENESGSYTISEIMDEKLHNLKNTTVGETVVIGRIKGKIRLGNKIYKISSKSLSTSVRESFQKEIRKIPLSCKVTIRQNIPLSISIKSCIYPDLNITSTLPDIPTKAQNRPLDKETIIRQLSKTASTPYEFTNIEVDLQDQTFLPKLSSLNELRRLALSKVEAFANSKIRRTPLKNVYDTNDFSTSEKCIPKISVLLNVLSYNLDYSKLESFDSLYIPLKYFANRNYANILKDLCTRYDTYIYMPTIIKDNYKNLCYSNIESALQKYRLKGFVISNISNIRLLHDFLKDSNHNFKLIANYTFNVFNLNTVLELKNLGINMFTLSPELDLNTINYLCNYKCLPKEMIVYGKTPLMNMNYCLLGETNKCYPHCNSKCQTDNKYYLKDRMNMKFRIIPDNIQTVTTLYNCKTTSISSKNFSIDSVRIDFLDENIEEINYIIEQVKLGKRLEGPEFTNGNLNREI